MKEGYRFRRGGTFLLGLALVVLASLPLPRCEGESGEANQCTVTITSPQQGQQVSRQGTVDGRAEHLPRQAYLWVLVRKHGFTQGVYPQGGGPAQISDGNWTVDVTYGVPSDTGPFDIFAVVVGSTENSRLNKWVQDANDTGRYSPTSFPKTLMGCPTIKLHVQR